MRDIWDGRDDQLELLVRGLTVATFVLLCWTVHRSLRPRETCVTSNVLRAVVIEGQRVNNCAFESRLQLGGPTLSALARRRLRRLEAAAHFEPWIPPRPQLVVEVDEGRPRAFDLYAGSVRLGAAWVDEAAQLPRALAMPLLKARFGGATQFQLETLADFVVLTSRGEETFRTKDGRAFDLARDVSFATAPATLGQYCRSPFRSLAHETLCHGPVEEIASAWGFEALLGATLARTYDHLPLKDQLRVIRAVRSGRINLPNLESPKASSGAALVAWFISAGRAHAGALQMLTSPRADRALVESERALAVEAPLHWEVTFDLRHTARWRDILRQLVDRARYRLRERALVFTPEGEFALPQALPVKWAVADVSSAKHVMIACAFPKPDEAVKVRAEHFYARQTCDTLKSAFWD